MSSLEQRLATVTNRATHLNLQLSKLNRLRDRVRQAAVPNDKFCHLWNGGKSRGQRPWDVWAKSRQRPENMAWDRKDNDLYETESCYRARSEPPQR